MIFKKILVPIDESENSIRAINNAVQIAKLTNGTVTLMHVYPIWAPYVTSSKRLFYDLQKEECRKKLERGKLIADKQGLAVETLMRGGEPVEQIVNVAKEGQFDLIVIGARGVGKLSVIFLGSVSQGVVNDSPVSVLVTK